MNVDGYYDVIVGAPLYDNGEVDEGTAYVWLGSSAGLNGGTSGTPSNPQRTIQSNQVGAHLGCAVAGVGDVGGEGYPDIIVGADMYDNGEVDEGRAWVFHGGSSGLASSSSWDREGGQDNAHFGAAVAAAGDVNGDGHADVIVGAPGYDETGYTDTGRAYVYLGSTATLGSSSGWSNAGEGGNSYFGYCVSTAGDVNGDGYDDVIVGSP